MTYTGGCDSVTLGDGLVGVLYTTWSEQPCPAAVLLHGIPGSEKNFDIAYRLREMGWHALILHFAGTWGSAGNYDMPQHPANASSALDFMLAPGRAWSCDPSRVALIGYSLGSRAALVCAARETRVRQVVSLAGSADYDETILSDAFFTNAAPFLQGADREALQRQWLRLGGAENPATVISTLTQPVLIVHGSDDDIFPYYNAEALHRASRNADLVRLEGADHMFTRHRAALVGAVTEWLTR
jgi:uncharacterized protein